MQFRIKLCLRFLLFPFFEKQCTFKLSSHLFPDKKEVKATGKQNVYPSHCVASKPVVVEVQKLTTFSYPSSFQQPINPFKLCKVPFSVWKCKANHSQMHSFCGCKSCIELHQQMDSMGLRGVEGCSSFSTCFDTRCQVTTAHPRHLW